MEPIRAIIEIEVKPEQWGEYASCLGEQEFYNYMRQGWELYVDLGPNRRTLVVQVAEELDHIPKRS